MDIDISKLKIPEDLEGTYRFATKGRGIFYFDIRDRVFVSAAIALAMEFLVDAAPPGDEDGGTTKSTMRSDNLIRVSLKR